MPKMSKQFYLEVTVEQFLEACSAVELQELELLLQRPRYRNKGVPRMQNPPPPPIFPKDRIEKGEKPGLPNKSRSPWDDDWDD